MICRTTLFYLLFAVREVLVLENGLAKTPPMGWMSWGYFRCETDCANYPDKCLNENLILRTVDAIYTEGYQEAGYEYIIIDDCWSEMSRDKNDRLVADVTRFPNGMKYIADYIHARGLKFGMYTNIANTTCEHFPGSWGHFKIDAETFASWGVDYLKVDGCYVTNKFLDTAYIDMERELNKTGRPIVYSCSWPYYKQFLFNKQPNFKTIAKYCNLWRNYHDVQSSFGSVVGIVQYFEDSYQYLAPYHKPGQWNDPDMLLFGQGCLDIKQSRIQLSVYAMLSAPLLLSCDMTKITPYEKQLLQNMDLLAIAQDPKGIMAKPVKLLFSVTMWMKPHSPIKADIYPSFSFLFLNKAFEDVIVPFTPGEHGLNYTDGYTILDVYSSKFLRNVTLNETIIVRILRQDVVLYTLYPL